MEEQGKGKNGQMAPTEKVTKECVQVSLSSTPEWNPSRIDTAEAIISVTLGYPKAYEEYHYEYQTKLYNMNIDLLAALGNDSELSSVTWSRGKLAQYISGIVVSSQHETATSYFGLGNLVDILKRQLLLSLDYFRTNRFALSWMAIAMYQHNETFERQSTQPYYNILVLFVWREIMNENNTLNEYSLGLAAQALIATKNETFRHGIVKSQMGIISKLQGKIPEIMKKGAAVSQILPALAYNSFLDIKIHSPLPGVTVTANCTLNIKIGVEDPILTNTTRQWNRSLLVSSNATLLEAMEALQNEPSSDFSFVTVPTSLGPVVITVCGIPRNETNMYWRIMKAPDIPLQTGIADTNPQNNDHYIFKLTSI
ncbi:transcobalamin-2-like [Ylistrum balloti]|uniref:transcobalamin-2-like n=1 Tax=Ylistrum balloti TaxID=509963 RepID=UPI00290584BF|nr:transcobalamin-2-like [Ylistrum balloti]